MKYASNRRFQPFGHPHEAQIVGVDAVDGAFVEIVAEQGDAVDEMNPSTAGVTEGLDEGDLADFHLLKLNFGT